MYSRDRPSLPCLLRATTRTALRLHLHRLQVRRRQGLAAEEAQRQGGVNRSIPPIHTLNHTQRSKPGARPRACLFVMAFLGDDVLLCFDYEYANII